MYTYGVPAPDMSLVAVGVVIWVVAISIAFGVYLPFLRAGREYPLTRRPRPQSPVAVAPPASQDGPGHAVFPGRRAASGAPGPERAPAVAAPQPARPQAPAAPHPEAPCRAPDQFSVLIVDDNAVNRQVLELILDSVGLAHRSVENGLEAVEAMQETAYDAVLMDLQMPVMDGFEATRRIRELESHRGESHSTIIVVSANCLDEHVAEGRAAGANAHLPKPISAGALIGELASCPTLNCLAA